MNARGGLLRRIFGVFGIPPPAPQVTLEDQICEVTDKDQMHRTIDSLPERGYGILLVEHPEEGGHYSLYGQPSYAQIVWMLETFKSHIVTS